MGVHVELDIRTFEEQDIPAVAELLTDLWHKPAKENEKLLYWKYFANSFIGFSLAYVGLVDNKIVAFRGFFYSEWANFERSFIALSPADAIVSPKFRRKGFFSKLAKYSIKQLEKHHNLFLNVSSNNLSGPGYLRLGWKVLKPQFYQYKFLKFSQQKTFFINTSDEVKTSDFIPYNKIKHLLEIKSKKYFKQLFDEDYYNWRFKRPNKNYVFIYHENAGIISSFLIIDKANNTSILHYADENAEYKNLKNIISYIKKKSSIKRLQLMKNNELTDAFAKKLGFKSILPFDWLKKIKKTLTFFYYRGNLLENPNNISIDVNKVFFTTISSDGA